MKSLILSLYLKPQAYGNVSPYVSLFRVISVYVSMSKAPIPESPGSVSGFNGFKNSVLYASSE